MYGRGLRALSISTVAVMAIALGLVFFYAPLEAEEGFLQKIFYIHVPLAIVALSGFVLGGIFAIQHLRTRDSRWDVRSYVAIHMSLIFAVGGLITGFLGLLMCPWYWLSTFGNYVFGWLVGYSGLLGPVAGIMVTDYFFIRGTRLDTESL